MHHTCRHLFVMNGDGVLGRPDRTLEVRGLVTVCTCRLIVWWDTTWQLLLTIVSGLVTSSQQ